MKLLFDQNLSFKLCALLSDLFPDSKQDRGLGRDQSDDRVIWQHAKDNGFVLASQDSTLDWAPLRWPSCRPRMRRIPHWPRSRWRV
jgi:predicted nuclease of predicted toxin-antitoxin system